LPSRPRHTYDAVSKQGSKPEESNKERRRREKRHGEVSEKMDEVTPMVHGTPPKKKKHAQELPATGGAPTTAIAPRPEPARQLMVNTVAAAAILVGVVMVVWNTLKG
jgi:hypothetical protein